MKALLFIFGLMMAGTLQAATTSGAIAVKLVIVAQCHVDGTTATTTHLPTAACSGTRGAQPKITPSSVTDAQTKTTAQLVTIEW
ncbi:hypothetical protein CIG19_12500 [Enterobacterales bacterium CwR94]|nr:hypothetical protein CIG19_12500 [Enterobacterales bacterium CwR94]